MPTKQANKQINKIQSHNLFFNDWENTPLGSFHFHCPATPVERSSSMSKQHFHEVHFQNQWCHDLINNHPFVPCLIACTCIIISVSGFHSMISSRPDIAYANEASKKKQSHSLHKISIINYTARNNKIIRSCIPRWYISIPWLIVVSKM